MHTINVEPTPQPPVAVQTEQRG